MSNTRTLATLVLGSLTLAACEQAPTEMTLEPRFSAERTIEQSLYDLTGSYFSFACNAEGEPIPEDEGELVLMEGQIFERITVLQSANGEYHYTQHTMPVGLRGTGVDSGEEFRVTERDHAVANQLLAAGNGMFRQELKMVGTDTQRTFWLVVSGVYRIDQNGEPTVLRGEPRLVCRPGH